ncbi:hypothetical protein RND81_08G112800 [Saponaria officinalis]|uniref:RING-type domain-containing protein n=1 Tax=Saponaria officinalis TaxID=3572 RepID=A0AAW1J7K3_SAPOF
MGFPSTYTKKIIQNLFINKSLSFLEFLRMIIHTFLGFLDLPHCIEPDIFWPEPDPEPELKSISANLIQEMLPVMKFADIISEVVKSGSNPQEKCVVCLNEFRDHEEIRRLANCKHILHRECVDRWMEHDHRTCPLCRTSVVPYHLIDVFNQRLQAAAVSCFPEFGSEFCVINSFL